jgi:uncharacterized damage-inducible protein DinB
MQQRANEALVQIRDVLLETYAVNDAMNQLLLAYLDARAWRAKPPGTQGYRGRTIAAIFAHLHNTRLLAQEFRPALEMSRSAQPRSLLDEAGCRRPQKKRDAVSPNAYRYALRSAKAPVTRFSRDGYVSTWPAGGTIFAYMFSHEAHHRGQILLLAQQFGYRLPHQAAYGIWHWEKLWKQHGFPCRPR